MKKPLFSGLVFDENDRPVEVSYVGDEPCYVVDDNGFLRHISSEKVDRHVLETMAQMIEGNESFISEQTAKFLGQDDIFSKAIIENQIKNIDSQFDHLLETGIPDEGLAYMGMMGFKIIINVHGDVIDIVQPGLLSSDDDE